jgi:hypothetical protein
MRRSCVEQGHCFHMWIRLKKLCGGALAHRGVAEWGFGSYKVPMFAL